MAVFPMVKGGGISALDFPNADMGVSFTSANGEVTVTATTVTNIKAVVFWFDTYPQVCGYGYLKNGTLVAEQNNSSVPNGGVSEINGNTFKFKWNNAGLSAHAVILGE